MKIWDLGQGAGTEYKYDFGATDVPREDFLQIQRTHRGGPTALATLPVAQNAQEVIDVYIKACRMTITC